MSAKSTKTPSIAETPPLNESFFPHPLPELPRGFPNGWMSPKDLMTLYNVARRTPGPVLEVGPWLGRSSSAIALGLRDRVALDGAAPVTYDLIDFGITSAEEWRARFNQPLHFDKDKGRVLSAVYHPGGTIAVLIKNLNENDLLPHVTNVIRGDFLECPIARRYGMIFCDATHDEAEIRRHLPKIAELAAPGGLLVFDDIVTEDHADMVCGYLDVAGRVMTRALYGTKRCKVMVVQLNGGA